MQFEKRLRNYSRKTITKSELAELTGCGTDEELYEIIMEFPNLLDPVKASKTNGNRVYPIYMKYRINLPEEDYSQELDAIQLLHPSLTDSGYLQKNPLQYRENQEWLNRLSKWLFRRPENIVSLSRKERSFEIFDEEKLLDPSDDRHFWKLIQKLGVTTEMLALYDTPKYCFNDFIPDRQDEMTLVICENKDIWFNLRRKLYEDGCRKLFGVPIDGVIYGNGNMIAENEALTQYAAFMGCHRLHFLYWGDWDREGLNIFRRVQDGNPTLQVTFFTEAYQIMLQLAADRNIPASEDHRSMDIDYEAIYGLLGGQETLARQLIRENRRLPQEIVNYAVLNQYME